MRWRLAVLAASVVAVVLVVVLRGGHKPSRPRIVSGCRYKEKLATPVTSTYCLHWIGWGSNYDSQVGAIYWSNLTPAIPPEPVDFPAATTTDIKGGGGSNYALQSNGTVLFIGQWYRGAQGNGTIEGGKSATPTVVKGLTGSPPVVEIAPGGYHPMALLSNHQVMVWGDDYYGEHGNGTSAKGCESCEVGAAEPYTEAKEVPGLLAKRIWSGMGSNDFAENLEGKYFAWGEAKANCDGKKEEADVPTEVVGLPAGTVKQLVTNGEATLTGHDIFLKTDGTVWTCGDNQWGQAGQGTHGGGTAYLTEAKQVPGLSNIVQVAAGQRHDLALSATGVVYGWGEDEGGQVGAGTPEKTCGSLHKEVCISSPVEVMTGVKQIIATHAESLAVLNNGTVDGWGENEGALGALPECAKSSPCPVTVPTPIPGLENVATITTCTGACIARARVPNPPYPYTITAGAKSLTIHWVYKGTHSGEWRWRIGVEGSKETEYSTWTSLPPSTREQTITTYKYGGKSHELVSGTEYRVNLEHKEDIYWGTRNINGTPE